MDRTIIILKETEIIVLVVYLSHVRVNTLVRIRLEVFGLLLQEHLSGNPEIVVLDEATSYLDNESEAIVQESINRVADTITTFFVVHRLSTIRRADAIYVMSMGRIVE